MFLTGVNEFRRDRRVAAEERAAGDAVFRRERQAVTNRPGERRRLRRIRQRSGSIRCRMSDTSPAA